MRRTKRITFKLLIALALVLVSTGVMAADKPNIVLILLDNLGYGELGVYCGAA